MKDEGFIIVGAQGTLGTELNNATVNMFAARFLFDRKYDSTADIRGCDLAVESEIETAVQTIPISKHQVWRLVLVTGIYDGISARKAISWAETRNSLQVNLMGVAQFIILFSEVIRRNAKQARIVVLSSTAGKVGSQDLGYGIAKAGLNGLVRSISKRYAKEGITIIGVAPGLFPSKMSDDQDDSQKRIAISQGHLGRATRLDEVLNCVKYAAFDAPDALTGTFINPNTGQAA